MRTVAEPRKADKLMLVEKSNESHQKERLTAGDRGRSRAKLGGDDEPSKVLTINSLILAILACLVKVSTIGSEVH